MTEVAQNELAGMWICLGAVSMSVCFGFAKHWVSFAKDWPHKSRFYPAQGKSGATHNRTRPCCPVPSSLACRLLHALGTRCVDRTLAWLRVRLLPSEATASLVMLHWQLGCPNKNQMVGALRSCLAKHQQHGLPFSKCAAQYHHSGVMHQQRGLSGLSEVCQNCSWFLCWPPALLHCRQMPGVEVTDMTGIAAVAAAWCAARLSDSSHG